MLLLAALTGGCTLIDQRTFNPRAGLGPLVPPGPPGPGALVTVDFGKPNPDYAGELRLAVDAALARKPDVVFDVITVVPAIGTPADQVAAATGITADAREIARVISSEGVDDTQIHLSARAQGGVTSRQVQVFVH
jgi:hypothetical protein